MASSPDQPNPHAGARLGPYQILRRLAVGGMAEIFEARRDGAEDTVVLKVLLPQYASDPEFVGMFADEARLTVGLDHPNLVRVIESGTGYFAMERVDGLALAKILRCAQNHGGLSVALALHVGERLLEALVYIHGRSDASGRSLEIVHRDISPGNVLVSLRGEVKLGDFGIARHRLRSARTRTGVIKGTVQYMAPEQVLGSGEADRRTDLYGVGLLLFEMLTGRPFIHGDREVDLLRCALEPAWTSPSAIKPDLDPRLDRLLRPALAHFPEERYADAGVFLAALRTLREQLVPGEPAAREAELAALARQALEMAESGGALAATVPLPAAPVTAATRRASGAHRRPWQLGAALLVGAALLGGAGFATWRLMRGGRERNAVAAVDSRARLERSSPRLDSASSLDSAPAAVPDSHHRAARVVKHHPPSKAIRKPYPDARVVVDVQPLRRRLESALAAARSRGVLEEDLPVSLRRRLAQLRAQLGRDEGTNAKVSLEELERSLPAVDVDRALVEAKLKRVDAILRKRPEATALRERASTALQEFMDGRYAVANRHLNDILRIIR